MSDPGRPAGPPGGDDEELGAPVAELADLEEEPAPTFLARLRRRIQRRVLASDVLEMSWFTPVLVLLEFLEMIFTGLFGPRKTDSGGSAS